MKYKAIIIHCLFKWVVGPEMCWHKICKYIGQAYAAIKAQTPLPVTSFNLSVSLIPRPRKEFNCKIDQFLGNLYNTFVLFHCSPELFVIYVTVKFLGKKSLSL